MNLEQITNACAKAFDVTPEQIRSANRSDVVCRARGAAIYIATKRGYRPKHLEHFFRKTHGATIHALQNVQKWLDHEKDFKRSFESIELDDSICDDLDFPEKPLLTPKERLLACVQIAAGYAARTSGWDLVDAKLVASQSLRTLGEIEILTAQK